MPKESIDTMKIFDDWLFDGINCGALSCGYNIVGICTKEPHNIIPAPFSGQSIFKAYEHKCPSAYTLIFRRSL